MSDRLLHARTSDPVGLRANGLWITIAGGWRGASHGLGRVRGVDEG